MRIRRNHRSAEGRASFALAKSLGTMTVVVSGCAAILAGACGDPQPVTTGNPSGSGGASSSSATGTGGEITEFTTSSTGQSGSVSSSSSGGPACPAGNALGGPTQFSAAFGDAAAQSGRAVAYDKSGNILLAGGFAGSINLGGTTLTSSDMVDVFVAKFNGAGALMWAKQFGGPKLQGVTAIGADAAGNVFLTGNFTGSINIGGTNLTAAGTLFDDTYVAKLSADGTTMWAKHFGDENSQVSSGLAVDSMGNVVVVGNFQINVNFGGATLSSAGAVDAFAVKFDGAGVHQWSRKYGDAQDQEFSAVTIDNTGNIYVAGTVAGAIDFGGGPNTATQKPSALAAKLDSLGNAIWIKLSKGDVAGSASGDAIAVGDNGDVAVGGKFTGVFDMGGDPVDNAGADNAFVTLYSQAGGHKYTKVIGDSEAQNIQGVAIAPNGEVFASGNFQGVVDFDSAAPLTSAGGFDAFLVRLNSAACPVWARAYSGTTAQLIQAMALDPTTSRIVLAGLFNGTADFGQSMLTASGDDVFLLTVNP